MRQRRSKLTQDRRFAQRTNTTASYSYGTLYKTTRSNALGVHVSIATWNKATTIPFSPLEDMLGVLEEGYVHLASCLVFRFK